MKKTVLILTALSVIVITILFGVKLSINSAVSETTVSYSTTVTQSSVFAFELNKKYTTRQQVYTELKKLSEAFESFCDDLDDESVSKNFERYKHYKSVLSNELSALPETKTDIVREKEKLLYETLDNCRDELHFAKENASLAGKTVSETSYSAQKEKLEKVSTAVSEYEKADITIDEALSKCGVIYENSAVNSEKNEDVSGVSE